MARGDGWEPARPAMGVRIAAVALAAAAALLVGSLVRLPLEPSDRITVETDPVPLPAAGPALRSIDPATLVDRGSRPVALRPGTRTAISDGGGLLAVLDEGEELFTVYELPELRARYILSWPTGRLSESPRFTPEGDALVLRRFNELTYRPLDARIAPATLSLPLDVAAREVVPLRGGRAAVFALGFNAEGSPVGVPHVFVADFRSGAVNADVPLPGIRAGQAPPAPEEEIFTREPDAPPAVEPGLAWDAERDRLYVAAADTEAVTVVDLAAGRVIAESGPPPPEPRPAGGRRRQAVVSPDGRRLYVTGARIRDDGSTESLGLHVRDTADLAVLDRVDVTTTTLEMAPDGRWLALGDGGTGVHLLDAAELDVVARLGTGTEPLGFDPSSAFLYYRTERRLSVFAVDARRIVATRQMGADEDFLPRGALRVEGAG